MSATQIASKRKKKFTGGNASKRHRDRVNIEFNNLAKLLPFPENVIAKLDKSSILRLAVSFIRAKSFFKDALPLDDSQSERSSASSSPRSGELIYKGILEETCLTEFFLEALDGFLIVITEDLKVLYVSESVRDYLGYCQAGIIHESFLQFIHQGDKKSIANALAFRGEKADGLKNGISSPQKSNKSTSKNGESSCDSSSEQVHDHFTDSNGKVESRRFVCRMKCAFSCSSRFYTAFRAFQFSGHVRRSTIQEGKELRTLNTLIAFGAPCASPKFEPSELVSEIFDDTRGSYSDDMEQADGPNAKMIGLHIEPRLRPHIAPIPIPQNDEGELRQSGQQPYLCNRRFGINMRPDPPYNAVLNPHGRIGSAFKLLSDYYQDSGRYSNGWAQRSSSLSNSPISDASSPRGLKRASSSDMSPDGCDIQGGMKNPRLDEGYYLSGQNGYNSVQLDDIHSSARILMQLQATQQRLDGRGRGVKDNESEGSSDEKSEISISPAEMRSHDFPSSEARDVRSGKESINWYCKATDGPADGKIRMNGYSLEERKRLGFDERELYCLDERERIIRAIEANRRSTLMMDHVRNRDTNTSRMPAFQYAEDRRVGLKRGKGISPGSPLLDGSTRRVSPTHDLRSPTYSSESASPPRLSPISRIPSGVITPKKDPNRGFHISTILGLEEKTRDVASELGSGKAQSKRNENTKNGNTQNRNTQNGSTHNGYLQNGQMLNGYMHNGNSRSGRNQAENHVHEDLRNLKLVGSSSRLTPNCKDRHASDVTNDASNLEDIKTSFAHILQGYTTTITQKIDRSIDSIFKTSEVRDNASQACKF